MANDTQSNSNDDDVLAQLYKAGATDIPPVSLDNKILDYATSAKKSSHVGSHFGGGWKVPLSMAACLVLVFGILVQVDQSSQLLEVPPIPELVIPNESNNLKLDQQTTVMDSIEAEEDSSAIDGRLMDDSFVDDTAAGSQEITIQSKEKALKKVQPEMTRERIQLEKQIIEPSKAEKNIPIETKQPTEPNRNAASKHREVESSEGFANKPESIQKQTQEPLRAEPALGETMQRSVTEDLMQNQPTPDSPADNEVKSAQEYAPIPVEDWLLMIEKLIARKDYAEAARQLQKFKQAHPKINVEDLDAKIP